MCARAHTRTWFFFWFICIIWFVVIEFRIKGFWEAIFFGFPMRNAICFMCCSARWVGFPFALSWHQTNGTLLFLGMFFPSFKVNGLIAFPLSAPKKPLINITKELKKKKGIIYMIVFVWFLLHSLFQSGHDWHIHTFCFHAYITTHNRGHSQFKLKGLIKKEKQCFSGEQRKRGR